MRAANPLSSYLHHHGNNPGQSLLWLSPSEFTRVEVNYKYGGESLQLPVPSSPRFQYHIDKMKIYIFTIFFALFLVREHVKVETNRIFKLCSYCVLRVQCLVWQGRGRSCATGDHNPSRTGCRHQVEGGSTSHEDVGETQTESP